MREAIKVRAYDDGSGAIAVRMNESGSIVMEQDGEIVSFQGKLAATVIAAIRAAMMPAMQYDEFGPCAPGDEPDTSDIPEAGKEFFERATFRPARRTAQERLPDQIIDAINSMVSAQITFAKSSIGIEQRAAALAALGTAEDRLRDLLRKVVSAR